MSDLKKSDFNYTVGALKLFKANTGKSVLDLTSEDYKNEGILSELVLVGLRYGSKPNVDMEWIDGNVTITDLTLAVDAFVDSRGDDISLADEGK